MASTPKVSVCIPIFNGAGYIRGALDSVFQQKYQDFEVVIVDNCSTDQTEALVAELSSQSEKICFFRNEQNIGLAGNLDKCLEYARGDYIKYLCVDDLLLPGCLEQMVVELDTHPEVSLVCGGRLGINESGRAFSLQRYSSRKEIIPGHEAITRCLYGRNYIGEPSAVMFRKSDVLEGFRDDLPQVMDMELWFRLLETGKLMSIESPLCSVRFHDAQMTRKNIKAGSLVDDNIRVFLEYSVKSYIDVSPWLVIRHKLLMTYRVWISRRYITHEKSSLVLKMFGIPYLYPFMPVISLILVIYRKIAVRDRV